MKQASERAGGAGGDEVRQKLKIKFNKKKQNSRCWCRFQCFSMCGSALPKNLEAMHSCIMRNIFCVVVAAAAC